MSLEDRTNELIVLSLHAPAEIGVPAQLSVDVDSDSSVSPSPWIDIALTDADHDSDAINMTHEEAGLLHDRLGLILGRPKVDPIFEWAREHLDVKLAPWQERVARGYTAVGIVSPGRYSSPEFEALVRGIPAEHVSIWEDDVKITEPEEATK